ncbi:kinase-like domain-containing protein [Hypomontagnella submonticulosa]|nr:kinase-like domain-containing protein [Hypomontagnella submonticulosa]
MTSSPIATSITQLSLELESTKILRSVLSQSLQDLSDERCRFVPRDALIKAISKEVVNNFLQIYVNSGGQQLATNALADTICPPANTCRCSQPRCTGGRIIFVTLLALSKENLITSFLSEPATCDASLPLLSQEGAGSQHNLPEAFQQLTSEERIRFIHFTWQMRSPFIEGFALEKSNTVEPGTILEYESNASLPWTHLNGERDTQESEEEELTRVEKVKIHPAHRDPDRLEGDLALKTFLERRLASLAEQSYKHEVQANHKTRQHERVVPLLAAFKHRGRFHLLLPWAHGGNLGQLFQKYATRESIARRGQQIANWYSEAWLLAECCGLADGLAAVHEADDTQHARTSAQIHADIKPENILCYASGNGGHGPFTLKLADFGEAQEVRAATRDVEVHRVAHTKTYRPPEHDTEDFLTLNYDVWCLGCVYLELVTWAIGGYALLERFENDRFEERDDGKVTTAKGDVRADTFFKKAAEAPGLASILSMTFGHRITTRFNTEDSRKAARRRHTWWFEYTGSRVKSLVKSGVKLHIQRLRELCVSPTLKRFIDFIDSKMLVIDPGARASSVEVRSFLDGLRRS